MTYQSGISNQWETMEARLCRIEKLVGKPNNLIYCWPDSTDFCSARDNRKSEDEGERSCHSSFRKGLVSVSDEISCLTDAVDFKLEALRVVGQGCRMRKRCLSRSMYLTGTLSLWRSRLSNVANANRERIEMWEVLKKELKDQFIPCNTSWIARESLRNLKHTKKVCTNRVETTVCQGLPSAIAAAYRLDDFKVANDPEQRNDDSGEGKEEFDKKFKKKEKAKKVVIETFEPRAPTKPTTNPLAAADSRRPADSVCTCLPACRVLLHIRHVLYQPSTSLRTAVHIHAPCLSKISAHRCLLAHSPRLSVDGDYRRQACTSPAVQPARTVTDRSST
ncbi:UNVERIFIED_CONTAM: hypothetical protein Scaly_3089400 [Sesamum calycinum]|uniref:Uncharacterized protein n=1 Tax=Sesamum calycinum TaxID=2727403 RepID=A0AAW2JMS1_9LAMI